MQAETAFTNARIVLADSVVRGSVMIRDSVIGDVSTRAVMTGEDLGGDYLLPGLIELHTDNLEAQHLPRPGVEWPAIPALIAPDALIAAAGITTVLDALRAGSFEPGTSATGSQRLAEAVADAKRRGLLRADHLIHLRCVIDTAAT